jgi:hypothetical protein
MARVTTEISAKSNMRAGLQRAKQDMRVFRNAVRDEVRGLRADIKRETTKDGGLFGGMTGAVAKGNLIAKGLQVVARGASEAAQSIGDMQDASEQLGLSAEFIGRLERVMETSGVSAENLRKGFMALNDAQTAVKNDNEQMIARFAELGISAQDVKNARLDELFFRVADGLEGMTDQGKAASIAMDLIGTRNNARMISTMRKGSAELQREMEGTSGAISDANTKAVDDTVDAIKSGWSELKGFLGTAAGESIRAAQRTGEAFKRATDKAGGGIREGLGDHPVDDPEQAAAKNRAAVANAHKDIIIKKEAEGLEERKNAAKERLLDAEHDGLKQAERLLSVDERRLLLLKKMAEARERFNKGDDVQKHEALADMEELKNELEQTRQEKIDFEAQDPQTKSQQKAEARRAGRRRRQAERMVAGKERDKIDRDERDGRITKEKAEEMRKDLNADKPENRAQTPEEQLLSEIRDHIKTLRQMVSAA